jgi:hypothetical protein
MRCPFAAWRVLVPLLGLPAPAAFGQSETHLFADAVGGTLQDAGEGRPAGPALDRPWTVPGLGLEMVWIAPGSFTMGSRTANPAAWTTKGRRRR